MYSIIFLFTIIFLYGFKIFSNIKHILYTEKNIYMANALFYIQKTILYGKKLFPSTKALYFKLFWFTK